MKLLPFLTIILFLTSCENEPKMPPKEITAISNKPFAKYSNLQNEYLNFSSVDAINKIVAIENEYFVDFEKNASKYYGTVWRQNAEQKIIKDSLTQYQDYLNKLGEIQPDSLHCTLYAYEGLKAGLDDDQLKELENIHRRIWQSREIAGWSIGYILVKYFNWSAYLFINPNSQEYQHCLKSYRKNKTYPVWKQPNIPLKELYLIGEQDSLINHLLMQNEFSWGFSEQGIHTWITRFNILKECNWLGKPSKNYQAYDSEKPLFLKTEFSKYLDYDSHVIFFPKKLNKNE